MFGTCVLTYAKELVSDDFTGFWVGKEELVELQSVGIFVPYRICNF